ncbi:MAG: MFS transporter [Acidobacteriota bacterium]
MSGLGVLMLVAGGAWIIFVSLFSALVQTLAPDWVPARVLAMFMLIFQGGLAAGSALWGLIGQREGIDAALLWAGIGTVATSGLGLFWRLPSGPADLSPWSRWRIPVAVEEVGPGLEDGPVLVTVEYHVESDVTAFIKAIHEQERVRRRDGASRWGIYRDTAAPDRFLETFEVRSWAEHLRQHARQTQADRRLEERIKSYVSGPPTARHLVRARRGGRASQE